MVCTSHVGFTVEGVTDTSDVFVACLFQHSCRGLAGLFESASSEGVRKLRDRRTGLKEQGSFLGSEPRLQFAAAGGMLEFS